MRSSPHHLPHSSKKSRKKAKPALHNKSRSSKSSSPPQYPRRSSTRTRTPARRIRPPCLADRECTPTKPEVRGLSATDELPRCGKMQRAPQQASSISSNSSSSSSSNIIHAQRAASSTPAASSLGSLRSRPPIHTHTHTHTHCTPFQPGIYITQCTYPTTTATQSHTRGMFGWLGGG